MPIPVDPYTAVTGANILAAELNARFGELYKALDPAQVGLDDTNIKAGAVKKANLNADALQAFLQLSSAATRKVKWGTFTSPALGSQSGRSSASGTIAHGMGVTPVFAVLVCASVAVSEDPLITAPSAAVNGLDGTDITYQLTANGTTNNAVTGHWLAIG